MRLDDPDSSPAAWAVSQFLHLGPGSRHRVFHMIHNLNSLNGDYIEDFVGVVKGLLGASTIAHITWNPPSPSGSGHRMGFRVTGVTC